jgi:hypothetical protein
MRCFWGFLAMAMAAFWGYVGYMEYFYTPPPPIPCRQGMTLEPGQSCYGRITLSTAQEGK